MNEKTTFYGVILRRFFNIFRDISYHGVPICKFVYYQVLNFFNDSQNINLARALLPYWEESVDSLHNAQIYQWIDEPYPYDAHPDGLILMRGGFGDIASAHLPRERFVLISPNQTEVEVIKLNRPDLTARNISDFYYENPSTVKKLNREVSQVIQAQKGDPFLGSPDFERWFHEKMPEIVGYLDAVQSLFQSAEFGAVLTVSSLYSMDGALNLIARANRIPSFTLQHGIIAESDLFCHIPILATKKMVWGTAIKNWYRKFGFPDSRLSVIGSPRFDIVFNRKWCGPARLREILGIDPAQKVAVYAAQIFRYAKTITPVILEGLRSIPDLFLVILLHPGENPLLHEQIAAEYPNCRVVRFGHISLYDALSGADLFLTYYSTAALEAMFFKLPVITVEPITPTFSFGILGASVRVINAAHLNEVVRHLLADENYRNGIVNQYREFLADFCIPDGSASKRLFDEMDSFCRTGGIA